MLVPKKVKHRKVQRSRNEKITYDGCHIDFGHYGMIALEAGRITNRQIEAARIAINRSMKRGGKIWIRIFPDMSLTRKGEGVRMGKGKGAPDSWVAPVRPGRVLFEVGGITEERAKEAVRLASAKLPIAVKFVSRLEV